MSYPRLISRRKHLAYFREQEASSSLNICEGCPYDFACCKSGETLLFFEEAKEISPRMELEIMEFAEPLKKADRSMLLMRGVSVSFRLKTPCHFFSNGNCSIHDFKPKACKSGICDYAFSKHKKSLTHSIK